MRDSKYNEKSPHYIATCAGEMRTIRCTWHLGRGDCDWSDRSADVEFLEIVGDAPHEASAQCAVYHAVVIRV